MSDTQQLTFGQKAVGLTFNPSNSPLVDSVKQHYADIIDDMVDIRDNSSDPEKKRYCSIAITEAQSAQMWAVKAITWRS